MTAKPPKKTKWYWHALTFIVLFWFLGGLRTMLFQDIPMLLFLGIFFTLLYLPISRWIGKPEQRWRNKLRKALWSLSVLAGTFAVVMFVIPPFSISPQTTYLTEPRSAELYGIDYATEIENQLFSRVPPGENGFRMLVETFGKSLFDEKLEPEEWERLCRYFDLPADTELKFAFISWREYMENLETPEGEIIDKAWYGHAEDVFPWPEEAMPIVRRWLDENDAALEVCLAAMEKPVLFAPPIFDRLFRTNISCDDVCWKIKNGLEVRVRYRLALGEIDEAWEDVLAMYRLVERHRPGIWYTGSSRANGYMTANANRCAEAVMLASGWMSDEIFVKAEEITAFQKPISEDEIRFVLRNERLMMLSTIQHLVNGDPLYHWDEKEDTPALSRFGQKIFLRFWRPGSIMVNVNRRFDDMQRRFLADDPKPHVARKSCPGCGQKEVETLGTVSGTMKLIAWHGAFGSLSIMGDLAIDVFCEIVEHWRTRLVRHEAETSLTRLIFSLEAYHREHGNYPETLDALGGEIPSDPFSGEAFRYETKPAGFLLYSVGEDDLRRQMPMVVPAEEDMTAGNEALAE